VAGLRGAQKEYGSRIANQIRRLGASCDWSSERFTLDAELSKSVAHAFCVLHEQGRVYRGTYMVNWAPQLQTAVSDLEVEYSEEPGTLFYFKYPLAGGGPDDFVPVSTTRPETILGDTAVAVHSEDPRFAHLVGRQLEVPFSGGRTIPLIADDYVDREFGTGALKVS
jgi:valyl-tRNA synthetase